MFLDDFGLIREGIYFVQCKSGFEIILCMVSKKAEAN